MSESRLRIPRMALATLVLGGGCGEEPDGGGLGGAGGTDASKSRITKVSRAICKRDVSCEVEAAEDEQTCVSEIATSLMQLMATETVCVDAVLDYYACYAALACEGDDDEVARCETLGQTAEEACEGIFADDEAQELERGR